MGANVWQRDTSGNSQGTSFKIGSAAGPHPARPGKRKLVWTKDQQDQPATPAGFTPSPAVFRSTDAPTTSYSQEDHFKKRARLNESWNAPQNGCYQGYQAPAQKRQQPRGPSLPKTREQQSGAISQGQAAVLEQRKKEAELAELKRRIQEHEEQAAEHKVLHAFALHLMFVSHQALACHGAFCAAAPCHQIYVCMPAVHCVWYKYFVPLFDHTSVETLWRF